ncbi:replication-relaxation family protein [Chloroflexota bacterium]
MLEILSPKSLTITENDLGALHALSLKGYRFLACRHLAMLFYRTETECKERVQELCQTGLITRIFIPTTDYRKPEEVYTLTPSGASELARLRGVSFKGLAGFRKPSYLFLQHGLKISDFMCSLEAALISHGKRLLSWRSERQLKTPRGRALAVPHPLESSQNIPVIPDGLFSFLSGNGEQHFFLEADRGTMSIAAVKNKMLGYIQLYRKGWHKEHFAIPHFRVLIVTTTAYRIDKLQQALGRIGYCPNMFWFGLWCDISPEKIFRRIWLRGSQKSFHSLLE